MNSENQQQPHSKISFGICVSVSVIVYALPSTTFDKTQLMWRTRTSEGNQKKKKKHAYVYFSSGYMIKHNKRWAEQTKIERNRNDEHDQTSTTILSANVMFKPIMKYNSENTCLCHVFSIFFFFSIFLFHSLLQETLRERETTSNEQWPEWLQWLWRGYRRIHYFN